MSIDEYTHKGWVAPDFQFGIIPEAFPARKGE